MLEKAKYAEKKKESLEEKIDIISKYLDRQDQRRRQQLPYSVTT